MTLHGDQQGPAFGLKVRVLQFLSRALQHVPKMASAHGEAFSANSPTGDQLRPDQSHYVIDPSGHDGDPKKVAPRQ
jgi:hypothetical protein